MTLSCLNYDERIWGRSRDCEEPGEGVSSGQTSSNDRRLGTCWELGRKDAFHEQKIQSQENKRTSLLGTLPVHVNRRGADTSICLPTRPSSTSLLTNLMKANSSQNESLFSWTVNFSVAKSTKSCRNSWKISRDVQKKPVICCLSWHAFRPHRSYWELRAVS